MRRAGFILLFGTRPIISNDPDAGSVNTVCPRCGQRADIVGKVYRPWFTLFFIPVFPIGGAKRFSQCSNCGAQFMVDARQIQQQAAASDQQQMQRAITLYNSMRASPANAVTLNELMSQYAAIGEYDQAISAARDFPQALQASEQCMVTLGRVHLAKNNHAEALRLFDEALARNSALGEAHYFKAVAHLTSTPPDKDAAAASARLAKANGYADADKLPV
jgi:tetratricopeptide (TPR) repeat protein